MKGDRGRPARKRLSRGAQGCGKFGGCGTLEAEDLAGDGMLEDEADGVEAEAARRVAARTIAFVACYGMTLRGKLDADLVLPARLEGELEEAVALAPAKDAVIGDGLEGAALAGLGHAHSAGACLSEPGLDAASLLLDVALHEGLIGPLPRQLVPARHEDLLDAGRGGEDEDARGVPVQAMDDSGPALGIAAVDALGDDVIEAFGAAALRGDHGQAGRLVHGDEVAVLMEEGDA
jgi:hypothetical protein